MCVLVGTTVKTKVADYPCATREEAEALFVELKQREERVERRSEDRENDSIHQAARRAADFVTD